MTNLFFFHLMKRWNDGERDEKRVSLGCGPLTVTVTTRIITFLVGDPYKPSFPTVTVRGSYPRYHHKLLGWIFSTWLRFANFLECQELRFPPLFRSKSHCIVNYCWWLKYGDHHLGCNLVNNGINYLVSRISAINSILKELIELNGLIQFLKTSRCWRNLKSIATGWLVVLRRKWWKRLVIVAR